MGMQKSIRKYSKKLKEEKYMGQEIMNIYIYVYIYILISASGNAIFKLRRINTIGAKIYPCWDWS